MNSHNQRVCSFTIFISIAKLPRLYKFAQNYTCGLTVANSPRLEPALDVFTVQNFCEVRHKISHTLIWISLNDANCIFPSLTYLFMIFAYFYFGFVKIFLFTCKGSPYCLSSNLLFLLGVANISSQCITCLWIFKIVFGQTEDIEKVLWIKYINHFPYGF